jgi:hypothetical protein
MSNYYYSGQGSLYVAERDVATGKPKGFLPIGNVPELTIDIEVTKFEHKESESGSRLLDLTIVKEKKGTFKFKLENLSLENLAMGLYGESAAVVGGSVVGETVSFYAGKRMPLAHPDVSAVVVKDDTDVTTYALGTDYLVDAANGVIIFPATGSTIVGSCKVSYTYGAYSKMEAFTSAASPERYLRFEGLNTVDNSRVIIDAYRAQFDPLTNYGLINDELAAVDMSGSLLADSFVVSGSPFFRQRNVAA